jgi:hypothetical protein
MDSTTRQQIATRIVGVEQNDDWSLTSGRELTGAMGQHFYISLPISKCFPNADVSKTNVSSTVISTLMLGLQPQGNHSWSTRGEFSNGDPEPSIKLTNYQMSVLVLSDAISRARMRFADSATLNKSRMEFYQWILISLGALTTILISLKSILNERTPGFVAVGVFAVIFSALSTACSSMISFYTPNDAYVRSDRALTQLRQLHNDLGFLVAATPDICTITLGDADDAKTKNLKDLSSRLAEILSASGASGQAGPNTGGSGQTGPR